METVQDKQTQQEGLHFLDYWRVIRSRKEIILAVALLVVLTGTAYTFIMPPAYQSTARILVREDMPEMDVFTRNPVGFQYNPYFLRTQYEIIKSRPILQQVAENLDLMRRWGTEMNDDGSPLPPDITVRLLSRSINVQQFRDTSIISISVRRNDATDAARIANEVAEVYRDFRITQKMRELNRGLEALQVQLERQEERVFDAEDALETLREELDISMLSPRGNRMDSMQLQSLEADRIAARVDMLTRRARYEALSGLEGLDLINASAYIVNDATLASLRRQFLDAEVQLSTLREDFAENHPEVRRIVAALDDLSTKLTEAVEGMKVGMRTDLEVAATRFNTLQEELDIARQTGIEDERLRYLPFTKAEREVEVQRSILESLQARVVQESLGREMPRTPVDLVEAAEVVQRPVSPNIYLNLILSVVLGLGAGVGLAFFIEYMDTSVKTIGDVERRLGLPVIGVIPQKVKVLIDEGAESSSAEAYRVLRTNMQFAMEGKAGGAYAVISGGLGEGKSTTLVNLAYVCAQAGNKVLIVDFDLRRPVQHAMFGMSHRFGLTNLLMRDVPIEETIKATKVPNLHLLPSGRLPGSALGVIETQRVRELIKSLKARYDYVFFDTPPMVGVSDASIITGEVDGVVFVVQYRKYPREIAVRAKQMIENVGGKIVGVVLNNTNVMRDDYYYYYHSYYSSYHYSPEAGEEAAATGKRK